ncbi:MAG: hypothetical protein PHS46_08345 [Candidatus Omnitrophica bacterium]|nr:hypothetical protein [Candidatus Omnitrophota bacterium]
MTDTKTALPGRRSAEATLDPIYFFQVRVVYMKDEACRDLYYYNDSEGALWDITPEKFEEMSEDEREEFFENNSSIDDDRLMSEGYMDCFWRTESIWLTRGEAERYGVSKSYDYGEKNVNWRVWCGYAKGTLAALLREHDPSPENWIIEDAKKESVTKCNGLKEEPVKG